MPDTPEQRARREIDRQLTAAGWLVQTRNRLNLHAAPGIALCETDVASGFADYMLFLDGKALGVLEAKAAGILQSKRAMRHHLATRPVAEKLCMLDSLRERALAIRGHTTGDAAIRDDNPTPRHPKP